MTPSQPEAVSFLHVGLSMASLVGFFFFSFFFGGGGHILRSNYLYMDDLVFAPGITFIFLLQNVGKVELPSPPRIDPQDPIIGN